MNPTSPTASDTTLRIVRVFRAPRERVFRAFVDPGELRAWLCPEGFVFTDVRVDAKTGMATDFVMEQQSTGRRYAFALEYQIVDAPNRIRWFSIWAEGFSEPGRRTTVTIDFRDVPGGTEMTLTHEGLPDAATRDDHGRGWNSGLDTLARRVS